MLFFEKKLQKYLVNSKKSSTFAPAFEKKTTGAVVQLVRIPACHAVGREFESRPHRQEAEASLLFKSNGPLAQLNRVPHYGCGGCRFESCMDHKKVTWKSPYGRLSSLYGPVVWSFADCGTYCGAHLCRLVFRTTRRRRYSGRRHN